MSASILGSSSLKHPTTAAMIFLFGQVASFEIAVVAWQKYTCILISAALAVIGILTVEEGDYVTLINQIITKRKTESEIFCRYVLMALLMSTSSHCSKSCKFFFRVPMKSPYGCFQYSAIS